MSYRVRKPSKASREAKELKANNMATFCSQRKNLMLVKLRNRLLLYNHQSLVAGIFSELEASTAFNI